MKNVTYTSTPGVRPHRRPAKNLYADDSSMLNGMSRKYEKVDQEVFDAFMDLRDLLLRRVTKVIT